LDALPPSDDPWREVRLAWLMLAIACLVPICFGLLTLFVVLPLFGIDPNGGVNPRTEPMLAAVFVACALVFVSVSATLGCVLASWVAMKRFTRSEVRSEYLRLMWMPKAESFNGRVFDAVFKSPNRSVAPRNKSLERTRER
jgi:hypothetical protein